MKFLKPFGIMFICTGVIFLLFTGCFTDNKAPNTASTDNSEDQGNPSIVISVDTSKGHALTEGFSGFNVRTVDQGWNYTTPEFKKGVEAMKPGWLRFFSGTVNDTFNWKTGLYENEWVAQFGEEEQIKAANRVSVKGPQKLSVYYKDLLGPLNGKVIIDVNAFTDSPESAGDLAKFCKDNNIIIEAYQLTNEPYFFVPSRKKVNFSSGLDYAKKMKPYADAIKAADPKAKVALSYGWDTDGSFRREIADYKNPYWDMVSIHSYATYGKDDTWDIAQKKANGGLFYATTEEAIKDQESVSWKGAPIIVTEYNVYNNTLGGTLMNGLYTSEYAMRMSSHPTVKHVGVHSISTHSFEPVNSYSKEMDNAFNEGKSLDTNVLKYGIQFTVPGLAMQIVNEAINNSTYTWDTSIAGGPEVEAFKRDLRQKFDTKKTVKVPGMYAKSYKGDNGKNYILVSNRSSEQQTAKIQLDGKSLNVGFTKTYIAGSNPKAQTGLAIKTEVLKEKDAVVIPAYSIVRLEWDGGKTAVPTPVRIYDTQVGDGQATLKWWKSKNVSEKAAGYEIKYGTVQGNYTESVKVAGDITSHTITGLANGVTYFFAVKAFNSAGESGLSNEAELKLAVPKPPELTAVHPDDKKVTVEWRSVPDASGYKVYYGLSEGSRDKSIDAGNVCGAAVAGLENGKTYYFSVTAYNGKGESQATDKLTLAGESGGSAAKPASAVPKADLPYAPQAVSVKAGQDNKAVLSWKSSKNITETYDIKRSLQPGSGYETIASGVKGTSYTDKLPGDGEYYYIITAKNENGYSYYHSSPASVIIGAGAYPISEEKEEDIEE